MSEPNVIESHDLTGIVKDYIKE